MADELLLSLKNVMKNYIVNRDNKLMAVNGVSLDIKRGETVGLVGESGCGKSTLGRTIVKLEPLDGGRIEYENEDIWSFDKEQTLAYRRKVQMIFQDPYASLDPLALIGNSVGEGIVIHKLCHSRHEQRERVIELLKLVHLTQEHANHFPHELSGGQRQRVGIARALAVNPELIVCDEPISALDVSIQAQVVNLLMELQKEMGLSYIFITHDISMVRQISDRIAVMYLGRIVEMAPSDLLYSYHKHPYTKALLSAIPIPDPEVEKSRQRMLLLGDVPSPINLPENCNFSSRCPFATQLCRETRPELKEISPEHFVACHYAGEM